MATKLDKAAGWTEICAAADLVVLQISPRSETDVGVAAEIIRAASAPAESVSGACELVPGDVVAGSDADNLGSGTNIYMRARGANVLYSLTETS